MWKIKYNIYTVKILRIRLSIYSFHKKTTIFFTDFSMSDFVVPLKRFEIKKKRCATYNII